MERGLDTLPTWYRTKKEQYLVGLDAGEFDLPYEKPYWERTEEDDIIHDAPF